MKQTSELPQEARRHEFLQGKAQNDDGEPTLITVPRESEDEPVIELTQPKSSPETQIKNLDELRRSLLPEMKRLREITQGKAGSPEADRYLELYGEYQELTTRMEELKQQDAA
ncbi:MAG: hypothetical protein AAB932_00190 [Patescibacteria group bacterium]